jgi:hypothetical protein
MRTSAIALSSVLAFALVGLFLPGIVARASSGCTVTWNVPTGTFSAGSTESASVSTTCSGEGAWTLTSQPSGTLVSANTFSCPACGCVSTSLFSSVLSKGAYQFTAEFNGEHFAFSFVVSDFFVVPEFPLAVLGAVVPFAALGAYALRRRYTN